MARIAFSADSHIVEPPEVFTGLEDRFGDRAPRIEKEEGRGDFLVIPEGGGRLNAETGGVGRLGIAGRRLDDSKTHEQIRRGYAGFRKGILDPVERLNDQNLDGVGFEALYPSVFFRLFGIEDTEVIVASFRNSNDWLHGYCSQSPERLLGLALLPMQDPGAAARSWSGPSNWASAATASPARPPGPAPTVTRRMTGSGRWPRRQAFP